MNTTARRLMAIVLLAACAAGWAQTRTEEFVQTQAQGSLVVRTRNLGPGGIDTGIYLMPQFKPTRPGKVDHPLFKSTYMGSPDKVVARTAYGEVTEQDLWLWIILSESFAPAHLIEQYHKAKTQSERERIATVLRGHVNDYVFTNQIIPTLAADIPGEDCNLRAYFYAQRAYELAYILNVVAPKVAITQADRVKYMQENRSQVAEPERMRVRYILKKSSYDDPLDDQTAAERELTMLRRSILAGETTFADAARAHSQAPSAANGGEVPAFRRGEMFHLLEEYAATLQPGEVSDVFRGPNGLYLVQLVELVPAEEATLENPKHLERVNEGLKRKALRGQFELETKQLLQRRRPIPDVGEWDAKRPDDVVGTVGDFRVTKCQFWMTFPELERENLQLDQPRLLDTMTAVLEREAMAQEVRECGFDSDRLVVRAREIAANMARRDVYVERLYNNLKADEDTARRFWRDNPRLFTPMAMKRVVKLTMRPATMAFTPEDARKELDLYLSGAQRVVVPDAVPADMMTTDMMSIITGGAAPDRAAGGSELWTEDEGRGMEAGTLPLRGVPMLPLAHFPKIEPTRMREKVAAFKSSDFVMSYADLGFVYLEDMTDIPAGVDRVPVGGHSAPVVDGGSAVCWFVEDARTLPKPPFEEIRTHVYSAYRTVEVGRKMARTYADTVAKARIRYSF